MNDAEPTSRGQKGRILYVITKATWGGAQRYVFDMASAALAAGFEVTVACGTEGELSARLMRASIPVFYIPSLERDIRPWKDIIAFTELWKLIKATGPDVVHSNSSKAGLFAAVAARLSGVKLIIFTAHGWFWNSTWRALPLRLIAAKFQWITVLMSHHTICVSEAIRREAKWMPFVQKKFVVIRNGIAGVELIEKTMARARLAPYVATDFSSGLWVGTLAELHPTKGLDVAIHAFASIAHQFPQTMLVLIGEGQDRNNLVALAKHYQLKDRIHFCGQVQHASSLLSAFDIFLLPSRSEALGFAALEAGSARLPVVASNVGGIPEVIQDGTTGLLVPVGDVNGFSTALTMLIQQPELRTRLGNALFERVATDFSKATMVSETLQQY